MSALPVSVVIPAYRRPAEVARAVRSVLAQSAPAAEVLVVDDASGDGTAQAACDAGARVLELAENTGEGGARNHGLEAATHDWVALLDSDDEWLPWHLERLWPLRDDHVVAGAASLLVGAGAAAGGVRGWPGPGPRVLRAPPDVVWPENVLTPSAVVVRRDAMLAAGGFPLRTPQAGDLDAWLRLLERGTGVASPHVGVRYHVHAAQMSGDRRGMHAARLRLYDAYRDRPWFDARMLDRMRAVDAWDLRDTRMLAGALARPQGAIGLAQTFAHRRRKARVAASARRDVALGVGREQQA